jgi:hypothetical protein
VRRFGCEHGNDEFLRTVRTNANQPTMITHNNTNTHYYA